MKKILIYIFIVLIFGFLNPAAAVIISTESGQGADAYIQSSAADSNFGLGSDILLKHDTAIPGNNRKSYIRFDLGSPIMPLVSASLEIAYSGFFSDPNSPNSDPSNYNVFGLLDGNAAEAWGESTVTWNNAPGNDTSSAGGVIAAETVLLGSFQLLITGDTPGDILSLSSNALMGFLEADTDQLVTFIITRQEQNFSNELFAAKEHLDFVAPTLNFEFANSNSIPVPTTLALFGLGLFGLGIARRKKL